MQSRSIGIGAIALKRKQTLSQSSINLKKRVIHGHSNKYGQRPHKSCSTSHDASLTPWLRHSTLTTGIVLVSSTCSFLSTILTGSSTQVNLSWISMACIPQSHQDQCCTSLTLTREKYHVSQPNLGQDDSIHQPPYSLGDLKRSNKSRVELSLLPKPHHSSNR